MLRRISTKWVLTVLAAVLVPVVAFAWYVDDQVSQRMWDFVRYYLLGTAGEIAYRIDREVEERRLDVRLWAENPDTEWTVGDPETDPVLFHMMRRSFDRYVERSGVYDLLLAVDARGRFVVSSTLDARGLDYAPETMAALRARDYSQEAWFREALSGEVALVDLHQSELLPPRDPLDRVDPGNYHIGFAAPVHSHLDRSRLVGAVFGLVNWSRFQYGLLQPARPEYVEGLIAPDLYATSYTWLWKADADTIIGHPLRDLYGARVSLPPVGLPQLVEAARAKRWGLYPEYEFHGVWKNAAFKHCEGPEQGGFGWVVGIGVNNSDVEKTVEELESLLFKATLAVVVIVVLGTVLIARRATRPILELAEHTRRIAGGDLDARIAVRSRDEVGDLARAFNRMTAELAESRDRLVQAEKDAAWREMARQVAHEIKNPLTPIRLSANLLRRARREESPEFEAILERTVDLILRQVEHMRRIASDFASFAGAHRRAPEAVEVRELCEEVLELDAAWAQELGVRTALEGPGGRVWADRGELRRVLINLVSNALEAMPDGGELVLAVGPREVGGEPRLVLEVRDRGSGLSEESRKRLFEPYFTTRSHGTGLGLAIAKRLVDEMRGTIALEPRGDGPGTVARVVLPLDEGGPPTEAAVEEPPA